jgi:hypothetical protein
MARFGGIDYGWESEQGLSSPTRTPHTTSSTTLPVVSSPLSGDINPDDEQWGQGGAGFDYDPSADAGRVSVPENENPTRGPGGSTTADTPYGYDQLSAAYEQYLGRSGSDEEYDSWLSNGRPLSQSISDLSRSKEAQGYSAYNTFSTKVKNLESETDPVKKAQQRDALARDLFSTLEQQGHDVKWQGEQLIVDGRAYDVAGGEGGATTGTATAAPTYAYKNRMGVLDWNKFNDPNHNSPKYIYLRAAAKTGWDTPAQREALLQELRNDKSGYFKNATLDGDKLFINSTDPVFGGAAGFDVSRGFSGDNGEALSTSTASWEPFDANGKRIRNATKGGTTGGGTGASGYASGSGYGSGSGSTGNAALDALLSEVLTNPESLTPQVVAMLKAQSKDELAGMATQQDEDLKAFGFASGIEDSPWLASERATAARERDNQLVESNRNIDLAAANTNQADRRSALQLGLNSQQFLDDLGYRYANLDQQAEQFGYNYGLNLEQLRQAADNSQWSRYTFLNALGLA